MHMTNYWTMLIEFSGNEIVTEIYIQDDSNQMLIFNYLSEIMHNANGLHVIKLI